jgi:hypothetical protein
MDFELSVVLLTVGLWLGIVVAASESPARSSPEKLPHPQ